uniref:Ig-like domain-containing protein n=1 Tax=Astyanax mexicanus TaxID=7994 RepID=A0A3B1K4K0_ASTMX
MLASSPLTLVLSVITLASLPQIVKASEVDLQVQTVKIGENVTLKCEQSSFRDSQKALSWYKQSFGKLPQFILRAAENNQDPRFARSFKERFKMISNEEQMNLKIINTVEEDAGTYFCVKVKDQVVEFGSGTLLLFSDNNFWIVAALLTFSMISVIVIVVLAVLLLKKHQKDTDAVNYAALNFKKKPASSRTPRVKQTQTVQSNKDIYSQVKVR